jgi:hypothetical protein
MPTQIRVLTGGPYHPTAAQFSQLAPTLAPKHEVHCIDGPACLDDLESCDLLVVAGLHWTGMDHTPPAHYPAGNAVAKYASPTPAQRASFMRYVASGKPLLNFHGGIACFNDWTDFGVLLGMRWDWKVTAHTPFGDWRVDVDSTGHPAVAGLESFSIQDELYFNVQFTPGLEYQVHAWAKYHDIRFPMIVTAEGGRLPGAGRTAWLANGHDLRALEAPAFRRVITNTIHWLLP